MLSFLGSLLGAGSSLLGGLFGQKNQANINAQNIAEQDKINAENIALQKEFAQNGIQWKVHDAQAAGINPLAALGASTSSFSNVVGATAQSDNSFGKGVSAAGQDIGRALKDTMAAGDQHALKMAQLQETHGELENQLLASQIAKYNAAGAGGPPTPAAGQQWKWGLDGQGAVVDLSSARNGGNQPAIKVEPNKVIPGVVGDEGVAPGVSPLTGFMNNGGLMFPVLSDPAAKAMSNDTFGNMAFRLWNTLGLGDTPPPRKGEYWMWTPLGWKSMSNKWKVW